MLTHTTQKLLKACSLFQNIADLELETLVAECSVTHPKRGELLVSAGTPALHVFIILMGSTKLVQSNPDGKERIVQFLFKNDLFGAAVVMNGGVYPISSIALEQSSILSIPRPVFANIFLKHPLIGQILITQMGERITQAHADRVNAYDSVEKRTAAFFLEILKKSRLLFGPTNRLSLPLTRQDIADRVGSTVETIIRTLSHWSKNNIISTHDKYIDILNESFLSQLTEQEKTFSL